MSIRVFWADEGQQILRQSFDAKWTWDDFYQAQSEAENLIGKRNAPIGMTLELLPTTSIPSHALIHAKNYVQHHNPKLYRTAIVSESGLVRQLYNIFTKIYPMPGEHFIMVASLELALEVLEKEYPYTKLYSQKN